MEPSLGRLTGFALQSVTPLDAIFMPLTLEDEGKARRKTILLHFIIVRATSEHNIILRRITILKFRAIRSPIHGLIKFPTEMVVAAIRAIKKKLIECNQVMATEEITRGAK